MKQERERERDLRPILISKVKASFLFYTRKMAERVACQHR